jgi:hypothetical protein
VRAYGETDQADRVAFTVMREKFGKRGDHWIAKRDPGTDTDRSARPARPGISKNLA